MSKQCVVFDTESRSGLFTSSECRDEMQIIQKGISPYENNDFRPKPSCCVSDLHTSALDSLSKNHMHIVVQLRGGNNGALGFLRSKDYFLFNWIVGKYLLQFS